MGNCSCFGPSKAERREADRVESEDARAKAAEAAQKRWHSLVNLIAFSFLQFSKSYGRF